MCDMHNEGWWTATESESPTPLLDLRPQSEIVVIGGGVIGLSATYWLAKAGASVTLLEARQLATGATGRNAGIFLPASSPLEDPMHMRSVLDEEGIDPHERQTGHLALITELSKWNRVKHEEERRAAGGPPIYALDRAECEALVGQRLSERVIGGRWLETGCVLNPVRLAYGIARAARRRGARLHEGVCARRLERRPDGVTIRTSSGTVHARQVLLAANAWSTALVPGLAQVVRPTAQQMLATSPVKRRFPFGMALDWGTAYWRQVDNGRILLGGCPRRLTKESPPQELLDRSGQAALEDVLPLTFPELPPIHVRARWAGITDGSIDGRPIVGPLSDNDGIWLALGFGGHGLPPALGVTKAIAMSLVGQRVATLDPFTPSRFGKLQSSWDQLIEAEVAPNA